MEETVSRELRSASCVRLRGGMEMYVERVFILRIRCV